ncbi:MAG TPA: histidine kinase [Nitrosopumilaceae archaeon]|nr:histidine kinase [Nitrosopumilaceae archaeon]
MTQPDVVPEKLNNPINIRIIFGILGVGVVIYALLNTLNEDTAGNLAFALSVGIASGVAVSSFIVSKRYWGTAVFGKSYLALGFAYFSYALAEVLYYTFDLILGIEPYPSVADIFFFGLYPLTITHLILNIRFFNAKISKPSKIWLPLIPIVFLIVYGYISFTEFEEANFDFYYGMIFVAIASITLSIAILGASVFRQGVIGVAWLLLVIGILMNATGDLWYYHLEVFGEYFDAHPVTVVWYVSNLVMIYALYKHQKIL